MGCVSVFWVLEKGVIEILSYFIVGKVEVGIVLGYIVIFFEVVF